MGPPLFAKQQVGQPQSEGGDVGHQAQHDQHRHVEDQDAARDGLHADTTDGAPNNHRRSDGRRQQADPEVENHDDAEVHGIDAERLDDGQEDRRANQQHRRQVHEGAERQEQHVYTQQEHELVAGDVDEELRGHRRHAHDRHHVAERDGEADHDHHHADRTHHARDQFRQFAPLDVAVHEHGHEEGIDNGHRAGLGGRKDTGKNATKYDGDGDHAPYRIEGDFQCPAQWYHLAFGKALTLGNDENQDDERKPEQQRWNNTGHEQMRHRDRSAGSDRIDDHVVRGGH